MAVHCKAEAHTVVDVLEVRMCMELHCMTLLRCTVLLLVRTVVDTVPLQAAVVLCVV